jgi:hypothetical protein
MATVNAPNTSIDQTVRIFDQFYQYEAAIPVEEYDIVHSYFASQFTSEIAAANFTVTFFRIVNQTGINAMTLLEQFQGKSGMDLTLTMAYYLNTNSSPTTMLGLNAHATPNWYVARNIVP